MVESPFPVIDGDGHVYERDGDLHPYLSQPYRDMEWLDVFTFFPSGDGWPRFLRRREKLDVQNWIRFLDECGIKSAYVYPTGGLHLGLIQDKKWAVALARAYNDWIVDRFMRHTPRVVGVALLPIQDVEAAVIELRRAFTDLAMPAALLPTFAGPGRTYGQAEFHPLYAEAERLGCGIALHGGVSQGLGLEHLDSYLQVHTLQHPFALFLQLTSMMFDGVFELFPRLRVACLECGCGWVPYLMDRLDEEYALHGARDAHLLKKKPSEYLRAGNLFVSSGVDEQALPYVLERLGEDQVFFSSDFPHDREREKFREDIPGFLKRRDLTDPQKRKVLYDNAARFYQTERRSILRARLAGTHVFGKRPEARGS